MFWIWTPGGVLLHGRCGSLLSCLCVYVCVYVCTFVCAHTWVWRPEAELGAFPHHSEPFIYLFIVCVCAVGDMGLSEDSSQDFMLLPHHVILKDGTQVTSVSSQDSFCAEPAIHRVPSHRRLSTARPLAPSSLPADS